MVSKRLDMLFDGSAAAALDALGPVGPGADEWQSHPLDNKGGGGKKTLASRTAAALASRAPLGRRRAASWLCTYARKESHHR